MKLTNLPKGPGVYIFKDNAAKIIYIGKAVNLRNRVSSYFQKSPLLPKTESLVRLVSDIETIPVLSEIEALILEANLIKKHQPYFNQKLRDDKDYLYIKVTRGDFPQIRTARKKDLSDALAFFGPFPEGSQVRKVLKTLRKVFPYSNCLPGSKRACFYHHIDLCLGVCVGKISSKDYKKMIHRFIRFMEGEKDQVKKSLTVEMKEQAKLLNFEKAAVLRQQIQVIDYITQPISNVEEYLENPNLLEDIREEQLSALAQTIGIPAALKRIECYDISNLRGEYTSGSMVVFSNGEPDTSQYRRFRVKLKGIDDYASLKEILKRRFENNWPRPDLIVIDGGKGQLNVSVKVLEELGLKVPIISLAKKEEEIYLTSSKKSLKLPRSSKQLQLIQLIRDEAHRFAYNYHSKLRRNSFLTTLHV